MEDCLLLDAGSGGLASKRLIENIFLSHFSNDILGCMDDAAFLSVSTRNLSFSTDSYTVEPLFFSGASIGSLAINGTVNDVAMLGAKPLWLSAAFILEEGLPLTILSQIVEDMAEACRKANIKIVAGDTKVVPRGACDKVFINTAGIGEIYASPTPSGHAAMPGDAVIISGTIGDHGLAVMAAREKLSFLSEVRSDCAPLADMIHNVWANACPIHTFRDPTRGGLATTLNEIAMQSNVCIELEEDKIPVQMDVADGCSFLGLDPLYLANEGKCICILPENKVQQALEAMRQSPYGKDAVQIGTVTSGEPQRVILRTRIGGSRYLGMLEGAQLPRIC